MRIILLLFIVLCFTACNEDEGCAPTEFLQRHENDTIFYGTWKWHYTVRKCTDPEQGWSSTLYDTIRQGEDSSLIGRIYAGRSFQIGDNLIRTDQYGTHHDCIVDWSSDMSSISIHYTTAQWPDLNLYMSMYHDSEIPDSIICEVLPPVFEINNCEEGHGFSVRDFYIKVN